MKLTISDSILKKNNISLDEYLILFLNSRDFNLEEINNSIIKKGLASPNVFNKLTLVLSDQQKEFIQTIYIDSCEIVEPKLSKYDILAEKIMQLYPEGKKPGTNYYWRDSKSVIAGRLKKLVSKYNIELDETKVINATKKYVESFNGDFKYMHLLKYFIWKNITTSEGTEQHSQLLSYIENEGQSEHNNEWGELI